MDVMQVFEAFCLLADLGAEASAKIYLPLCHWATAALYGRLREDVDVTKHQSLLCHAAGAMAFYKYVLRSAALEGTSSFSAGDVKVTESHNEKVAAAKAVYDTAMASVDHLLLQDGFVCMGVSWR